MKKLLAMFLIIGALFLLFNSSAQAASFTFQDTTMYWGKWNKQGTGWSAGDDWSTDDQWSAPDNNAHRWKNSDDTIGKPEITGGGGEMTGTDLSSLYITYKKSKKLPSADLFIDVNADNNWDYVLHAADSKIYKFNSQFSAKKDGGQKNWYERVNDYYSRKHHPYAIKTNKIKNYDVVGSYTFGNFTSGGDIIDFSLSTGSVDLGTSDFIIAFGPECANDVIYERVNNPVPIPTTLLLFGTGLIGLAGIKRRRR